MRSGRFCELHALRSFGDDGLIDEAAPGESTEVDGRYRRASCETDRSTMALPNPEVKLFTQIGC